MVADVTRAEDMDALRRADGRALRPARRDDVQRRLRHRRRDRRHRAGADAEADGRQLHRHVSRDARGAAASSAGSARGHLIIVSSIVGKRGVPYMGAYSATKFAQVGLAECLRAELRRHRHPRQRRVSGLDRDRVLRRDVARDRHRRDARERPRQTRRRRSPTRSRARSSVPFRRSTRHAKSRALVILNAIAPGFADRLVKTFGRKPVRREQR